MRPPPTTAISRIALLAVLALAGCGSSGASTNKETTVSLKSAAIVRKALPALYTCDGKNIHPPLEWGTVPADTRELALFLVSYTPVPSTHEYSVAVDWAVSGVNPALHRLAAGQLPRGAHVGIASDGKRNYSVCPNKGTKVHYQFELYGLPALVKIPPDFAGLPIIATLSSRKSTNPVNAHGGFVAFYTRR